MHPLLVALYLALPASQEPHAADLEVLLEGVRTVGRPGVPGPIAVFGEEAFAVVTGASGGSHLAVVAATELDEGRIVAFGHGGFLAGGTLDEGDTRRLLVNSLRWAGRADEPRIGVWRETGIAAALVASGMSASLLGRLDGEALAAFDAVVADLDGIDGQATSALAGYVRSGGGLVTGGLGWGWQQLHPNDVLSRDHGANRFLRGTGLLFGLGYVDGIDPIGDPIDVAALEPGVEIEVEVELGKTTPVTVDLRESGLCELALTVDAGVPVPPFDVYLVSVARPDLRVQFGRMESGEKHRDRVLALGPARIELEFQCHGLSRVVVPDPTTVFDLPLRGTVERSVHVPVGQLAIALPEGVGPPESGRYDIALTPSVVGAGLPSQRFEMFCSSDNDKWMSTHLDPRGRVRFDALPPGAYRLSLKLIDHSKGGHLVVDPLTNERSYVHDPILEREVDIVIVAGILTEVELD